MVTPMNAQTQQCWSKLAAKLARGQTTEQTNQHVNRQTDSRHAQPQQPETFAQALPFGRSDPACGPECWNKILACQEE